MGHLAAPHLNSLVFAFLMFLGIANVALDLLLAKETRRIQPLVRDPPLAHYTFIDEDYPPHLALQLERKPVKFSLEESVHYGLTEPETTLEWAYTGAVGDSNIRLGPNYRFFNTGFSYQLHCARYLVSAFREEDPLISLGDRAHVSRCLNVIRQFALCSADITLEPEDSMSQNLTAVREGGDRTCRDWSALYATMQHNWVDWKMVLEMEA